MAPVTPCPEPAVLRRFLLGTASPPETVAVEAHLPDCEPCGRRLPALDAADGFVAAARHARPDPLSEADRPAVEALIRTLRDHRPDGTPTVDHPGPGDTDTAPPADALDPPDGPDEIGRLPGYRVLGVLGEGGMGRVYRAEDVRLGRAVALKVIRPRLAGDESSRRRFLAEARAAAALSHDHVVPVFQAGEHAGTLFLAMPLLRGETLESRLVRGPVPVAEAVRVGRELAEGLAAAHAAGLVHRDVKPSNVWLEEPAGRVKLLDFGLARGADPAGGAGRRLTQAGAILGTPGYAAPEQVGGEADHRADLFAVGCVLYRMLCGELPFRGRSMIETAIAASTEPVISPRTRNRAVSATLSALVVRLLAADPAGRPSSARAVADDLAAIAGRLTRPDGRRRGWAIAAGLLVAAVGAGLAGPATYRVLTDKGEVVIETDDPDVTVVVRRGGEVVEVSDAKTGRTLTLKAGAYEVAVGGDDPGLTLSASQFELRRGEKRVVTVTRRPAAATGELVLDTDVPAGRLDVRHGERVVTTLPLKPGGRVALPPGAYQLAVIGAAGETEVRPPAVSVEAGRPTAVRVAAVGEIARFAGHAGQVWGVAVSADGRAVASAAGGEYVERAGVTRFDRSVDCTARVWPAGRVLVGSGGIVRCVALSAAGATAATGGDDRFVRVWDAATGTERAKFAHPETVTAVAVTPSGGVLAGDAVGGLRLWDVTSGTARPLAGHMRPVRAVAVSADGRRAFSGGDGRTVVCWDLESGAMVWDMPGHAGEVAAVAVSADGRIGLSGGHDGTAIVWDLTTGTAARTFTGHRDPGGAPAVVAAVALTPDGRRAATAAGNMILLWDVGTGAVVRRFDGHAKAVRGLAVSADGRRLASGGWDRTVRVWGLPSD